MFTRRVINIKGSPMMKSHITPLPSFPSLIDTKHKTQPVPITTTAKRTAVGLFSPRPVNTRRLHPRDLVTRIIGSADLIEVYYGSHNLFSVNRAHNKLVESTRGFLERVKDPRRIPLTRALYPNQTLPDVIAVKGWGRSLFMGYNYQLRLDRGVSLKNVNYPGYLLRSVRPDSIRAKKLKAYSIMDSFHGISPRGSYRLLLNWWSLFCISYCFFSLYRRAKEQEMQENLESLQEKKQPSSSQQQLLQQPNWPWKGGFM